MTDSTPKSPEDGSTRVDLGEDLLFEKAPTDSAPAAHGADYVSNSQDPAEQMRNATILCNEGFLEDAKRVLRQVLIADPHFVPARTKLEEIHELELKQILSPRESTGFLDRRRKPEAWIAPEEVLRKLDADLGLGLIDEPLPSILSDPASVRAFAVAAEVALEGTTARDRLDLGIAFLEMGLAEMAITQFLVAAQGAEFLVSATSLLASAQVVLHRPLEAIQTLEPLIYDQDIARPAKLELIYMMGRAHEARPSIEDAVTWYRQAQSIERGYRDTEERIRRLGMAPTR